MGDHERGHDLVVACDPEVDQEPFDPDLVVEGHFDDSWEADRFDESLADTEVGDHLVAASYPSDLGQVLVPS